MRVLIAGSSGFLGQALTTRLRAAGHTVTRLVRRSPAAADETRWHPVPPDHVPPEQHPPEQHPPDRTPPDPALVATVSGADAVINLAGSPVAGRIGPVQVPIRFWTAGYRVEFRASRVGAAGTLARAIAAADPRPAAFLTASGVGWYGETGDVEKDERAPAGHGYFAELSMDWEAAARPATDAGVRVVRLRTGLPLGADGGVLGPLLTPFRLGLGGRVGDGRQWMPWIALADWLAAVEFLLEQDDLAGPVNLVGPAPATNADFTAALAAALHRPAVIPVPPILLRTVLGEFGREVASSKRVVPTVLRDAGFTFAHPDLAGALQAALA